MSKTVTLEVSDLSSIELDFFFQISWTKLTEEQKRAPGHICCMITHWAHSSSGLIIDKESVDSMRSQQVIKRKDKESLILAVTDAVRAIQRKTQSETDPRWIVRRTSPMEKFVHAAAHLYLYEFEDQVDSLLGSGSYEPV